MCKGGESKRITVMTRPGDVIAGGSGGMVPCPPPQHQPPGIYLSYTWHIPGICQQKCHIPGIFLVYTNGKKYISGIYLVYIIHKPFIWRSKVYTWHTPTQNFLQHFGTCHVTVWTWYIPSINLVYTRYMLCPKRHVTGTDILQKVLSRCMSGIYCISSYERYMHVIYQVYTWYILFSISIYQVYTWYMTFHWHIPGIY